MYFDVTHNFSHNILDPFQPNRLYLPIAVSVRSSIPTSNFGWDVKSRSLLSGALCLGEWNTTLGVKVWPVCGLSLLVRSMLSWLSQRENWISEWNISIRRRCYCSGNITNLSCDCLHLLRQYLESRCQQHGLHNFITTSKIIEGYITIGSHWSV